MGSFKPDVNLFFSALQLFIEALCLAVHQRGATFVHRVDGVDYLPIQGCRQALFQKS